MNFARRALHIEPWSEAVFERLSITRFAWSMLGRGRARATRGAAVLDEGIAKPIVIGRRDVFDKRL